MDLSLKVTPWLIEISVHGRHCFLIPAMITRRFREVGSVVSAKRSISSLSEHRWG